MEPDTLYKSLPWRLSTAATLLLGLGAAPALAQAAGSLPGGASSLRETHGNWAVACQAQAEGPATCAFSQERIDSRSRQRVLALELRPAAEGGASGILVLPFGLELDAGVELRLEGGAWLQTLRFRTCLPAGCLVALDFDAGEVATLRAAAELSIVVWAEGGEEASFPIPLQGFASALDRTAALLP